MSPSTVPDDDFAVRSDAHAMARFLWWCAGADADLLKRCPNSDRVKYQGLGGIVLATSILALCSGSYAFYTVFSPKEVGALNRELHTPSLIVSIVGGIIWGLVIFNLDRFIVSSTGKGDGTERVTLGELRNALPRILMGAAIGISISAPLEIRVLQAEIDAQLTHEVNKERDKLNEENKALFETKRGTLRERIDEGQKRLDDRAEYFEKRRLEIKEQRRLLELEAEGKTGSGAAGRGPAWKDKKETLDKMEQELNEDRAKDKEKSVELEAKIAGWKKELEEIDKEEAARHVDNERTAQRHDGLLRRIQIAEDIGGSIALFIRLLLLAIELSPIFFKMMMTRGVYDALAENQALLIKARAGIESEAELFRDGKNQEEWRDVFHRANSLIAEEKRRLQTEAELAQRVH
ncbi:MAG: DUF4407 domain-containing protein, partial [Myxococcales bacterium]